MKEAKAEASELYAYLTWLDPYVHPRRTSSNYFVVDLSSEGANDSHEEEQNSTITPTGRPVTPMSTDSDSPICARYVHITASF